jgi:hypothetical protein
LPRAYKVRFLDRVLERLKRSFEVVPMSEHARRVAQTRGAPAMKIRQLPAD